LLREFLFSRKTYEKERILKLPPYFVVVPLLLFEEFIIFGTYPRVALISQVDDRRYYLKGGNLSIRSFS